MFIHAHVYVYVLFNATTISPYLSCFFFFATNFGIFIHERIILNWWVSSDVKNLNIKINISYVNQYACKLINLIIFSRHEYTCIINKCLLREAWYNCDLCGYIYICYCLCIKSHLFEFTVKQNWYRSRKCISNHVFVRVYGKTKLMSLTKTRRIISFPISNPS